MLVMPPVHDTKDVSEHDTKDVLQCDSIDVFVGWAGPRWEREQGDGIVPEQAGRRAGGVEGGPGEGPARFQGG